jgi:peptidyl-prolyl cis-trans isomerase A (cyclophilin A)
MKTILRTLAAATAAIALVGSAQDKPRVEMKTSIGTIVIELDANAAPKSVENFLAYV